MNPIGSVTSLGVGSGFDLQQMLSDFREVDEIPIDIMREDITEIEAKVTKFEEVKAKLIEMKSHALNLTLESNYLDRQISVSDEDVVTATALPGSDATSMAIEVSRMATKSSWQTAGVANADTISYVPTIQESTTGVANTSSVEAVGEDGTLVITYGSDTTISVDLTDGMTMDDIVDAINTDAENNDGEGGTYVTASTFGGDDGNYYLRIASTAEGSSEANRVMIADSPESLEFEAPDVAFAYTLGDGDPITVSVPADATFGELAQLINDDENNAGITASVINDGTSENPYRLVITAYNTGEDNRLSISGIQMTEVQGADGASLNAEITVNGIIYERQSNEDIDDIIQGAVLNLENEGTATVSISSDTDSVKTEIMSLVESYNDIVQYIKTESAYNEETEEWGALNDAYSIKWLPAQLNSVISTVVDTSGGSITSMYDLGLEINRDGSITMDEETLDQAISSNMTDISTFFTSDTDTGRQGFGDILNDTLRNMTASNGIVENEMNYSEGEIDRLEENIDAATERLDRRYEILTWQFVELDKYIGSLNSQSEYLTRMFDSFNSDSNSK